MNTIPYQQYSYDLSLCSIEKINKEEAAVLASILSTIDPWKTLSYSEEKLYSYLVTPDALLSCFSVKQNNQLVGTICVRYPWLKGAYLELLGIMPEYQNLGIGRVLLNWLEAEATKYKAKNIWALVSSFNVDAIDFYYKNSFQRIGDIDNFVKEGYSEILLRKAILGQTFCY